MIQTSKISKPYTALAEVYDEVMKNVDYEVWADFIRDIITIHPSEAETVLELACGTGGLTFELEKLGDFEITATDLSPEMIEKARKKTMVLESDVEFRDEDFLDLRLNNSFDVIISVFDSVNYLLTEQKILKMFDQVASVMKPGSVFIFDFTTPKNSMESIDFLDKQKGSTGAFHFSRKSRYDADRQIHYNTFDIEKRAGDGQTVLERYTEEHQQRAYTLQKMKNIMAKTGLTAEAAYAEFDLVEADKNSSRITMVLTTQDS